MCMEMAAAIKAVGAERCILARDMGAAPLDLPINGFVAARRRVERFRLFDSDPIKGEGGRPMTGLVLLTAVYPPDAGRPAAMPYAPAILVPPSCALLFVSGCTASPLYHAHPHVPHEHRLPGGMREQAQLVFENIKRSLDAAGVGWTHVIKVTRYLVDMREQDELNEVQRHYLGEHVPASTTVEVAHLVTAPARLEIEVIAAVPAPP